MSFSFIGCTIYDNPPNLKNNPAYVAWLEGMNPVDKARNLYGNWYARPEGDKIWKRSWVRGTEGERVKTMKDIAKRNIKWFRGWDKGYSTPSDVNRYPDFSACSPMLGKDMETGFYYLVGNYHPDNVDPEEIEKKEKERDRVYGQFRKLTYERDEIILAQAKMDGSETTVVLTKDTGGQATDHQYTMSRLIEEGVKVSEDTSAKNTPNKKVQDFLPFCNACQMGLVFIIEESFPNKATLEFWYKTLEIFTGAKSTGVRKDDLVDAVSMTFGKASVAKRKIPMVIRNQRVTSTVVHEIAESITIPSVEELPSTIKR